MERYDIDVFEGEKFVMAERSVAMRNSREAWPRIAEVAKQFGKSGTRIRVSNEAGEIVIQVGIETVNQYRAM